MKSVTLMRGIRNLFLVFFCLPYTVQSQVAKLVSEKSSYETSLIIDITSKLTKPVTFSTSSLYLVEQFLYRADFYQNVRYSLGESSLHRIEAQMLKRDMGLAINANFRLPSGQGFFDPEENFLNQRYFVQLGWDLFHQGLYMNRKRADAASLAAEISDLEDREIRKKEGFKDQYNRIIAAFLTESRDLLQKRLINLDYLIDASEKRSYLQAELFDDHLEFVRRKEEAHFSLNGIEQFMNGLDSSGVDLSYININDLPLLDVDLPKLKDSISHVFNDKQIAALKIEMTDTKHPWFEHLTLKPYLRYGRSRQGQLADPLFNNGAFDAGIQIRIPLDGDVRHSDKFKSEYARIERQKGDLGEASCWNEILSLYTELTQLQRQYRGLEVSLEGIKVDLRNELIQSKFDQVNHTYSMMQSYDALIATEIELVELKKRSYIRILQIDRYLANDSIVNYLKEIQPFQRMDLSYVQASRVRAKDLLEFPYNFISGYLLKNHISELIVSAEDAPQFLAAKEMFSSDGVRLSLALDDPEHNDFSEADQVFLEYATRSDITAQQVIDIIRRKNHLTLIITSSTLKEVRDKDLTPSLFLLKVSYQDDLSKIPSFINGVPVQLQVNVSEFSSRYDLMTFIRDIRREVDPIAFVMDDLIDLIDLDKKNFK